MREILRSRIIEAERWYRHWLSAADDPRMLRSVELNRSGFPVPILSRQGAVERVCTQRTTLLASVGQTPIPASLLPSGRLLLYDPDLNLFCGGAENATNGFFDVNNVPPGDFWIAYIVEAKAQDTYGSYLLSWIPTSLVDLVDKGVQANPEQCIAWADRLKPRSLRGL